MTWTWSRWCRSKLYFCNPLSPMLYLPWTKRYYWDTYCLRGIWICLYSYMFLLELMVLLFSLSCYVCWLLISCLAYYCSYVSYRFCWRFPKLIVCWQCLLTKFNKPSKRNKPTVSLVNPAKDELVKTIKITLDKMNKNIRENLQLNQWKKQVHSSTGF